MNKNENSDLKKSKNDQATGKSREDKIHILSNSEEFFESTSTPPPQVRTKLTRAELLAGHSAVDDRQKSDPRIKSPDEFLLRAAPKKLAPDPIVINTEELPLKPTKPQTPASISGAEAKLHFDMPDLDTLRSELDEERKITRAPEPIKMETPAPRPIIKLEETNFSSAFGTAKFDDVKPKEEIVAQELNRQHQEEIRRWKEYAAGVKAWQTQVTAMVNKLKGEVQKSRGAQREIEILKEALRKKEEEMKASQPHSKATILGWMKGFGRAAV